MNKAKIINMLNKYYESVENTMDNRKWYETSDEQIKNIKYGILLAISTIKEKIETDIDLYFDKPKNNYIGNEDK